MKMKKTLAFLLGLTMMMPSAAVCAFAEELTEPDPSAEAYTEEKLAKISETLTESDEEAAAEEEIAGEDIPAPPAEEQTETVIPHLFASPAVKSTNTLPALRNDIELPESVDLRKMGLVTPIRNQGLLGTCWAHAVMSCLETGRIKADPHIDLSERYLATYATNAEFGDGSYDLNKGGTPGTALGELLNWIGPVSERVAPYGEEYNSDLLRDEVMKQAELHVTGAHSFNFAVNSFSIENRDALSDMVKQVIFDGYSLYLSCNFDPNHTMNPETFAMYDNGMIDNVESASHAVTVVGYDDNFSADNFLTPPPADGAWLVKNSWGLNNGDCGYYWISYYDITLHSMVYFDAVLAEEHDTLYAYDEFGSDGMYAASAEGDTEVYISNEFTAVQECYVRDVMVNGCVDGDLCEVTVYTGLAEASDPTSGEAHEMTAEILEKQGYQTITLSEPVHVGAGETFAVVAKLSGEQGYHVSCECADSEEPQGYAQNSYSITDGLTVYNTERILMSFGQNQSFFSTDGQNWTDLYDCYLNNEDYLTGNICLKAMTIDAGKVRFSTYDSALPAGTEIGISSPAGKDIYYSVNGGAYQLYTAPICLTEDMLISAYEEGSEELAVTRHYTLKKAEISSLLVHTDFNSAFYADILSEGEIDVCMPINEGSAYFCPITTGHVTDGTTECGSYGQIPFEYGYKPFYITLTAEEEGLPSTDYQLFIHQEYAPEFTPGQWLDPAARRWICFNEDGKTGAWYTFEDGAETAFTYSIDRNRLTLETAGEVRTGYITSDQSYAWIHWDDGSEVSISFFSEDINERYCYTNAELCALAEDYFTAVTGEKPASITAAFTDMFYEVILTIVSENGETSILTVDPVSAVGTLDNGDVVNMNLIPTDTGVTSFKPGFWIMENPYGAPVFYYFDADGKTFTEYSCYDTMQTEHAYQLENGQMKTDGMSAAVILEEDTAVITWNYGYVQTITYYSNTAKEDFTVYSHEQLKELASAYFEQQSCRLVSLDMITVEELGEDILRVGYNIYGQPYVDYAEHTDRNPGGNYGDRYFYVNRFTAAGTDWDGNEIDLNTPVDGADTVMPAGIWRAICEGEYLESFYWFGEDGCSGLQIDPSSGERKPFTYRICMEEQSCILDMDGEKQQINCIDREDGDYEFCYSNGRIMKTELLTYHKTCTDPDFTYYSVEKLGEMAAKDYEIRSGIKGMKALGGIQTDGIVELVVFDPDAYDAADFYYIDPFTGLGTDQNGADVNLPQTGNNDLFTLLLVCSAIGMTGIGAFVVSRSGIIRRREDRAGIC